ncbi:FAD-binding oxidoreductase [Phenylobacterium sp.]|uniref:NAD(P)/FAD-dependent oxidoreductase n=1 Tax=Phenylobacterium sp. TaxID=1871053 RepID=UPI002B66A3E4|nr:FAD-binding oxidoreductase [Phenylobacterium sp.]HLZ74209.1 FAD-binding oxidoreductase [Phenylobacterium sp.]
MSDDFDVVVIGAGMAGASIAAHLAATSRVGLLEMEDQPGYHSTGRSAAIFSESYGNGLIRDLTRASRPFFDAPPPGFTQAPLLKLRRVLHTARDQADLDAYLAITPPDERETKSIDEARALVPIIRPEGLLGAVLSLRPSDIDVDALHRGYLRRFQANGGELILDSPAYGLQRLGGAWTIETRRRRVRAPIVVNAAGAWAGEIAALAGAVDIGLQPLKRTAILLDPPPGVDVERWPMLKDAGEQYYLKPDAGKLLLSPCDEAPSPPGDAQADEMTVAIAVDRIEQATTLEVRRVSHRWAGLRSFVADRSPVVGFDPLQPGFFWLAALGGYGIQTAPALSRLAANLLTQSPLDPDLEALDLPPETLSPRRFILQPVPTALGSPMPRLGRPSP